MTKKAKPVVDDSQWAGTDASLVMYMSLVQQDEDRLQAGISYSRAGEAKPALPYLLEVSDNIGIISIKGPMSNRTGYWDEIDKRATYPAIREALVTAAAHPDVDQILLDIDSGGGGVAGVADVGNLIREISTKVKPVTAFTDGNMMSAAYWLASAADKVYASKVAGVGSIGVIATHMEMSKMMEQMGINVTVMRAGKYKALANSAEPLTKEAKEQMQAGLDATYGVFVQHVADMRGVSYKDADMTMAQGREFYGEAAVKAGLIDGIETFDSLMSKLSVDKRKASSQNSQNATTGIIMKKALTEQDIAAIASGVQVVASTEPATEPAATEPAATEPAATEPAATEPAAPAADASEAAASATPSVVTPEASVVTFLQAQIKDKDAALLQTNIELNAAKAKITDFEASMTGLLEIAAKSTNNMRIALGGSALDMSQMTAAQVLAEHGSVSEQFKSKFVAGGVAAVDAAQPSAAKKGEVKPLDAVTRARLEAIKPSTRK